MNLCRFSASLVFATLVQLAVASAAPIAAEPASQPTLAAEHEALVARIKACDSRRASTQDAISTLQAELRTLRETLAMPGIDAYVAGLLTERRRQLPDVNAIRREIRVLRDEANAVHVRYLELEEQILRARQAGGKPSGPLSILERLRDDHKTYWRGLAGLSSLQDQLRTETLGFMRVIDERALWLPSARPLYQTRFPESLVPPHAWDKLGRALSADVLENLGWYIALALLLVFWLAGYPAVKARDARIRQLVQHTYTDSFRLTVEAIGICVYRAVFVPAMLWFLSERLAACVPPSDEIVYEFGLAVSVALHRTAMTLCFVSVLWRMCRRNGVAYLHLRWNEELVRKLRKALGWLIWIGTPAIFVGNLAEGYPDSAWRDSVGRISGLVVWAVLTAFFEQLLRPARGKSAKSGTGYECGHRRKRDWFWYWAGLAVPVALAVGMLSRYPHTAAQLGRHLFRTLLLLILLVALRSLVIRFVQVSRDRLDLERARRDRADDAVRGDASTTTDRRTESESGPREAIDAQTRTLLYWLVALGLGIGGWFIWRDIFPAFSFLGDTQLWTYGAEGGAPGTVVHLADLLFGLVAAFMTIVLARNGPTVVETLWLVRLPLDNAARFAVVTILRYVVVVVGATVSLGAVGLGWSRIQWLAAGVTVGLGFGLQEIFANFISGLIILFERPVRIGDIVTVGGVDGQITRIRIRATTVIDGNRRELIVPNKEFITGQIINWTLSDPVTRVDIPVGIAYGSNTRLARELLLRIAAECRHVLADPAPMALFRNFGDSTLDFELRVFIPRRDVWAEMIHELHTRIDEEFRRAGIEIAFPQRDINLRSVPEALLAGLSRPVPEAATVPVSESARSIEAPGGGLPAPRPGKPQA